MSKLCINCQSDNIEEVVKNDRRFFYCKDCKQSNPRFLDKDSNIFTFQNKGKTAHVTVGVLIREKNSKKYLFLKKRSYPYDLDIPAGHQEYGESGSEAVKREVIEETGLEITHPELVYHQIIENDPCRYGADTHSWYVYETTTERTNTFINSEASGYFWLTLEEALSKKLVESARKIINDISNNKTGRTADPELNISGNKDMTDYFREKQTELLYHLSQVFFKTNDLETIIRIAEGEIKTAFGAQYAKINLENNNATDSVHKDTLTLPIRSGGKILGTVVIERDKKYGNFREAEIQLINIVVGQLAAAIENNNLIHKINKEKSLLSKVIENSDEGIVVISQEGIITVWNEYLENLLHIPKEKVVGLKGYEFAISIGLAQEFPKGMIKNNYEPFSFQKEIMNWNGEKIWFDISVSYLVNNDEKNMVVIARNITKEKELNQAKNDLVSTATHELRTPLTAVKGYLSMILEGDAGEVSLELKKYLERAYGSTERLVALVEDLLSTLRIDENKVTLEKSVFDVNQTVDEAIESLKSKADANKIKLIFARKESVFACGDAIKSKHIVENLVDNAIKYTKPGGKIEIAVADQKNAILVSIKDSGIGIARKYLNLIFDRFSRVPNRLSVKAGGTGLGLYIAKSLVEKQGGRIWVESEPEVGSVFNFTIPKTINTMERV